jgi:UDP-N-acetylmuramate dehydrogenase
MTEAMHTLRGTLETDADMGRFVSWRAGGRAERLYTPADIEDLCVYLRGLPAEEPVTFVGLGSNLLVRDGGLAGSVIALHGALKSISLGERRKTDRDDESPKFGIIHAEAGVASPKLASFAAQHDLVGAEFLAGIPGCVGGALAMNAGCHGHETWEYVSQVQTVDRHGRLHQRTPAQFRVAYRSVKPGQPREEWFVAACFLFPRGDGEASRALIKQLLAKRAASQPLTQPNAGSVFRNPPGDYAARLIESCGFKGHIVGGAQVSEKHANFIVNLGGASATDIETLIETVQAGVEVKTGVRLEREVRILGEQL